LPSLPKFEFPWPPTTLASSPATHLPSPFFSYTEGPFRPRETFFPPGIVVSRLRNPFFSLTTTIPTINPTINGPHPIQTFLQTPPGGLSPPELARPVPCTFPPIWMVLLFPVNLFFRLYTLYVTATPPLSSHRPVSHPDSALFPFMPPPFSITPCCFWVPLS